METINGEWYMKGCAKDDPNRLHTVEDAAALVQKIGFLPLFSNDIPGFSVEERTLAADWWKDDPTRDPWAWRQILSRHPRIIYGKFFDRRAGFVSTDWFPTFANYRRNGYDFDTLIDEGLAPQRHRKLMQPYLTDGLPNGMELHSFALKAQAGFGKGGEKNFEGTLTELEMQSYLCIGDFRQRTNKKGQPYGWHIAIITPPETKLGYDRIAEAYREAPENSWRRITEQIQSFFPEATDDQLLKLQKLLGIRR